MKSLKLFVAKALASGKALTSIQGTSCNESCGYKKTILLDIDRKTFHVEENMER